MKSKKATTTPKSAKAPEAAVETTLDGKKKGSKSAKPAKATKPATKSAKKAKPAPAAKPAPTPRADSKGAQIIALIGREGGATLAEIMKATEWQAHSVRGFLSTAGKKRGIKIASAKNEAGERFYSITK